MQPLLSLMNLGTRISTTVLLSFCSLTLNGVSAVGVLGMGILGTPIMGGLQDRGISADLKENHPAIHQKVVAAESKTLPLIGEVPSDAEDACLCANVHAHRWRIKDQNLRIGGEPFGQYDALLVTT